MAALDAAGQRPIQCQPDRLCISQHKMRENASMRERLSRADASVCGQACRMCVLGLHAWVHDDAFSARSWHSAVGQLCNLSLKIPCRQGKEECESSSCEVELEHKA